jgi:CBS domain-containing protein
MDGREDGAVHTLRNLIQRLDIVSAAPEQSVREVAELMNRARVGAIPILDGDSLVGIFSERDLLTRVVVADRDPRETRVSDVMTHDVMTANLDDSVDHCLDLIQRTGCRHLPVVHDGRAIAMLSMRDLLRDGVTARDEELSHLRAHLAP